MLLKMAENGVNVCIIKYLKLSIDEFDLISQGDKSLQDCRLLFVPRATDCSYCI